MATLVKQAKRGENKVIDSSYIGAGCCKQAMNLPSLAYISIGGSHRLYMNDKEELIHAIDMLKRQLAVLEEIEAGN